MEKEKHIEVHKRLHEELDDLVADWICQTKQRPSQASVLDLMQWSAQQVKEPTENNL